MKRGGEMNIYKTGCDLRRIGDQDWDAICVGAEISDRQGLRSRV